MKKILTCLALCSMVIGLTACSRGNKYNFDGNLDVPNVSPDTAVVFTSIRDAQIYMDDEFHYDAEIKLSDETLKISHIQVRDNAFEMLYNNRYYIFQKEGYNGNICDADLELKETNKIVDGINIHLLSEDDRIYIAWWEENNYSYAVYDTNGFDSEDIVYEFVNILNK